MGQAQGNNLRLTVIATIITEVLTTKGYIPILIDMYVNKQLEYIV